MKKESEQNEFGWIGRNFDELAEILMKLG